MSDRTVDLYFKDHITTSAKKKDVEGCLFRVAFLSGVFFHPEKHTLDKEL
jgi:hypothetical protein